MTIRLHRGDLPDLSAYKGAVAIDTEAMGLDPKKDQAYMLARLTPRDLDRLWFPLGESLKPDVRRKAREAGLGGATQVLGSAP